MLPTDEETRYAILEALYEEKRSSHSGLSFDQMHDKLYIPWPILWFNLDYLLDEKLIVSNRRAEGKTDNHALCYEISEKGQTVMENSEEYVEKYPFLAIDTDS